MRGKEGSIIVTITIAVITVLAVLSPICHSASEKANRLLLSGQVHNIDTDEYFNEIQTAIDDPDTLEGHTIEVAAGTYFENVVIDKSITLIGEDRETTFIDGGNINDVIYITADWVNITQFSIQDGGDSGPVPMFTSGIELNGVQNCTIAYNKISKSMVGINFRDSNFNTVENNIVYNHTTITEWAGMGIHFWDSNNNIISNNTIHNNWYIGIYLNGDVSNNNTLCNNVIYSNDHTGIGLSYSDYNTIFENTISDHQYGFGLSAVPDNNLIYHNNILNNTIQACDEGNNNNNWDNGYPSGGNYWSDYNGSDIFSGPNQNISGSDGIGDTPYTNIQGGAGAQDNYPLMNPFGDNDATPPSHSHESPPINGTTSDTTPEISVHVTDPSTIEASSIRFYVEGFMVFYNLTAIPGGYEVAYWHESGFAIDEVVTCRIVAEDIFGNELDFTWQFTITDMALFSVDLHNGWNLVSFPLIPANTSIEQVLSSISGQWDMVDYYNSSDTNDHWKTYATFKPASLNDLWNLDNTMGFWLRVTNTTTLVISGTEPVTTEISLLAGWNMVGYPSQNNLTTVSIALWGTGADKVEVFDPAESYRVREVGPNYLMKPGEGYWIHVLADSVWIVNW